MRIIQLTKQVVAGLLGHCYPTVTGSEVSRKAGMLVMKKHRAITLKCCPLRP